MMLMVYDKYHTQYDFMHIILLSYRLSVSPSRSVFWLFRISCGNRFREIKDSLAGKNFLQEGEPSLSHQFWHHLSSKQKW